MKSPRELLNLSVTLIQKDLEKIQSLGLEKLTGSVADDLCRYSTTLLKIAESEEALTENKSAQLANLSQEELEKRTKEALKVLKSKKASSEEAK